MGYNLGWSMESVHGEGSSGAIGRLCPNLLCVCAHGAQNDDDGSAGNWVGEYRSNVRFLFACSSIMWNIDGGNNSGTGNPLFTENLDPNTSSSSSSSSSSSVWSNVNSSNPNNNSNNLLISGSSSSSVKNSSKNAWDPSSSTSASNWKNSGPTGSVGGSSDWCGVVKASADVNNSAWSQSRTTQGENSQSVCSSSWSEIARKASILLLLHNQIQLVA
ncbi:GRB10-interacting GYF protein [Trichinella spiralis]|uniref:GRB10-interacting GYF protein n=1 Tax=Trichinella spiralis TaxID=6334 RepID=A0ABR3KKY0_TRISP